MVRTAETRPPQGEPGSNNTPSITERTNYATNAEGPAWSLSDHLAHFECRILSDALQQATADHWRARAQAFTDAIPRPDDYTGNATPEQLEARARSMRSKAEACRIAASIAPHADIAELVAAELADHGMPSVEGVAA